MLERSVNVSAPAWQVKDVQMLSLQDRMPLKGKPLLDCMAQDPCYLKLPLPSQPGGAEKPQLAMEQAQLVKTHSNGIIPAVYDTFERQRIAETGHASPWSLDRSKLVSSWILLSNYCFSSIASAR